MKITELLMDVFGIQQGPAYFLNWTAFLFAIATISLVLAGILWIFKLLWFRSNKQERGI